MDYENKRKEEIIRATQLWECGDITRENLEYIFPELRESEDEKIRKVIRGWICTQPTSFFDNGISKEEILAWLEKQGEQNSTPPKWRYKKDKTPLLRDSIILNKYGCVAKSPSGAIVHDVWVLDYEELAKLPKEEIEKQGEQAFIIDGILTATNFDKMFQSCRVNKFNVGDWITDGYLHCKISAILDDRYIVDTTEFAKRSAIPFKCEDYYHLWKIADAKNGDVLFCRGDVKYSDGIKFERILLFENLDKSFFVLTKISNGVEDYGINVNIDYPDNIIPATREQKEILFMAMKEAGYEWDEEKKVLKKIEQKSIDKVEPKFHEGDWIVQGCNILKIRCVGNEYYCYETVGGYVDDVLVSEIDSSYHLWTIQDAKDGDVLACPLSRGYEAGEQIFIFKGINSRDYVDDCIEYYCRVCKGVFYENTNGYMGTTSAPLYPATKEQCDTLFAAMREAGYEWDAEKKELRKIDQKSYGQMEKCIHCQFNYTGYCNGTCILKNNEQKSADNAEPKFKVGDWIVTDKGDTIQIGAVNSGYYTIDNGMDFSTSYVDKYWHLWTIQDAKAGDILFHSDSASNGIFIFKELLKYEFGEKAICYCDYDSEDHFCLGEHHTCCWTDAKILHPATKEQRDLLFQKMKEAGYEWDAEKKELRKMEQKPKWTDDDKQYLLVCKNALRKYQLSDKWDADIISKWLEDKLKQGELKPTWTKEDKSKVEDIVYFLDTAKVHYASAKALDDCITWLKSIKQRMEEQQ